MDFDEKILTLFVQCPALYDKRDPDYSKSPILKENLWKSISEQMDVPVEDCQTRMKQLRDRYNRARNADNKAAKSGSGSYTSSTWPLMGLCSFWNDVVKPRNTVGSIKARAQCSGEDDQENPDDPLAVDSEIEYQRLVERYGGRTLTLPVINTVDSNSVSGPSRISAVGATPENRCLAGQHERRTSTLRVSESSDSRSDPGPRQNSTVGATPENQRLGGQHERRTSTSSSSDPGPTRNLAVGATPIQSRKKIRRVEDHSAIADQIAKVANVAEQLANRSPAGDEDAAFSTYITTALRPLSEEIKDTLKADIMQLLLAAKQKDRNNKM